MLRRLFLAATTCIATSGVAFGQQADGIFGTPEVRQFEGQDIDANLRLLEALTREAKTGPKFRVSPERIFLDLETGDVGAETVRISNTGDEPGEIRGINALGSVEGLSVNDNCSEVLSPGAFCDIAVRFEGDVPLSVQTAIIVSIQERERSSFDVPVKIEMKAPVIAEPVEDPNAVKPEDRQPIVIIREPEKPKGPASRDIAGMYFRSLGGMYRTSEDPGFTIVSLPSKLEPQRLLGVEYSDIKKEYETSDERYSKDIPWTQASLPVDRDNILTSDRVIKAVLDTPVSNVMCGKVVAVIESDVYSATGHTPLIQAGSRAIGTCGSFADERVGIAWNRILTTDGRSITFENTDASTNDSSGLGGGLGRVYRSNFDKYVLPIFSTMIDTAAGVIMAKFGEDEEVVTTADGQVIQETSAKNEGIRLVTDGARGTAQELISEIRDVREVMVLPAGSRIDIEISEDIYFKDRREIIRVADTKYNIDLSDRQSAPEQGAEELVLVPYRKGISGPVVTVNNQRFVVLEKTEEDSDEETIVLSPARSAVLEDLAVEEGQ